MNPAHIHWLLELIIIRPAPVSWLLPVFNARRNDVQIPRYRNDDYARLIVSALETGLIELVSGDRTLVLDDAMRAIFGLSQGSLREKAGGVVMRMTANGGKRWEALAEPVWDRFVKSELTYLSADLDDLRVSGLLASTNRDVVIGYLGWLERLESVDIQWDSLAMATHSDYWATYWKVIADVHEANFGAIRRKTDRSVPAPVWGWKMALSRWHIEPWHRPDWGESR